MSRMTTCGFLSKLTPVIAQWSISTYASVEYGRKRNPAIPSHFESITFVHRGSVRYQISASKRRGSDIARATTEHISVPPSRPRCARSRGSSVVRGEQAAFDRLDHGVDHLDVDFLDPVGRRRDRHHHGDVAQLLHRPAAL